MCEHGTDVEVENLLAFNGEWHRRTWKIDSCISPIVRALNEGGVETTQSCCGHGKGPGRIDLRDGRVLTILDDEWDGFAPDDHPLWVPTGAYDKDAE